MRIQTAAGSVTVQARKCVPSTAPISAIGTRVGWAMAVRMAVLDLVQLLEEVSGVHIALDCFQGREVHLLMRQPREWS